MSSRYTLSRLDSKKIAIGAGIAVGGALLTYLTEVISNIDLGQWTPIVVSIWSIVVNVARKWLAGPDQPTPSDPPYGGTE